MVYKKLLQPLMRQHQGTIDKYVEMGEKSVRKQMTQLVRVVLQPRCRARCCACAVLGAPTADEPRRAWKFRIQNISTSHMLVFFAGNTCSPN
jgi:hypothetical protein